MAANPLQDFGNGLGYIYITDPSSNILSNIANDLDGARSALMDAVISAPLSGNISSYGTITFSGVNAAVTGLSVNGVSIISGAVPAGVSIAATVADLRDNINAFTSTPDYTAVADGATLYIIANPSAGSTPNGYAVAVLTTMTTAIVDMHGGSNVTGTYSETTGHRYFLNADYDVTGCSGAGTATEGDLTNSVEISSYIINRGFQTSLPNESGTVTSDALSIPRISCITIVSVDTEGSAATDDLYVIEPMNYNIGDIVLLRATNFARQTTVRQAVGISDNIQLANGSDFVLGLPTRVIALELINLSGTLTWSEIFRSPNLDVSVTSLRAAGISMPAQGVQDNALTLAAEIITLVPGSSPEYQRITGNGILTGNVSVVFGGTPKDGDFFFIDYAATLTIGGFSVVIGSITLTTEQALSGGYMVYAYYELATLTWHCQLWKNTDGVDLVDSVQLATKEDYLGLPGLDGYVLASTTAGVRYWSSAIVSSVLYDVTANNATTAITTQETLKTYTLPSNELSIDGTPTSGSIIKVTAIFQTAANAHTKTMGITFGATTVIQCSGNFNNSTVMMTAEINRVTQTAQSCIGYFMEDASTHGVLYTTPTENLGGTVVITAFGTNGTASAGDIISRSMSVVHY